MYGWIADDPKVLTGVLVALTCMAGVGGVAVGGLWTYYAMKKGADIANERAGAHQVRQNYYYHEAARPPAGGQVVDGEALPLPSQGALATPQAAWLPGLRTWEVKEEDGLGPDAG